MKLNLSAIGRTVGPIEHTYDWDDIALYALAVGIGPERLQFLLEPSPSVLPTFGVIPATRAVFAALELAGGSLDRLLHSAQLTEQLRPLPARGVVSSEATVLGISDMRVGAMLQIETRTSHGGELCVRTVWSLLILDVGPFEGSKSPGLLRTKPPKDSVPLFSTSWQTQPTQALLYRLTGDLNPIHARPEAAKVAGLTQPILHGLCTYAFASQAALAALCDDQPARFKSLEARFSKPVLPGQTLLAEGYALEPGKAALTVKVVETGELVIANALFQYEV
jgi:acyl dehydratase